MLLLKFQKVTLSLSADSSLIVTITSTLRGQSGSSDDAGVLNTEPIMLTAGSSVCAPNHQLSHSCISWSVLHTWACVDQPEDKVWLYLWGFLVVCVCVCVFLHEYSPDNLIWGYTMFCLCSLHEAWYSDQHEVQCTMLNGGWSYMFYCPLSSNKKRNYISQSWERSPSHKACLARESIHGVCVPVFGEACACLEQTDMSSGPVGDVW